MNDMPASQENRFWKSEHFFKVWRLKKPTPTSTPDIHYNSSEIEINIFTNVNCDAYINGKYYSIKQDCVVFIPPGIVHTFAYYEMNPGTVTAIYVNTEKIKSFFNLEKFLSAQNVSYMDIPTFLTETELPLKYAEELSNTNDIHDLIIFLMNIFKFFQSHIEHASTKYSINESQKKELMEIIAWTQKRMSQRVTLDDAATAFGYSKSYFCKKFKKLTGLSYIDYLTQLRILNAGKLLKIGYPIKNVADMCGFEDASYFIHKFKSWYKMTPKKFAETYKNDL